MKGKKRWVCLLGGLLGALAFGYALFQGIDIGTDMVRSELLNAVSGSMKGRCDVASVSGNPIVGYRIRDLRILSGDVVVATVGRLRLRVDPLRLLRGGDPVSSVAVSDGFADLPGILDLLKPSDSDAFPALPRIALRRVLLDLPVGPVSIDRVTIGALVASQDRARVTGTLSFRDRPVSLDGELRRDGVAALHAAADVASLDLSGPLTGAPFSVVVSVPDLSKLSPLLPSETPPLSGKATASLRVAPSEQNIVAGRLSLADMTAASLDIPDATASFGFDGRRLSVASLDATVMETRVTGNGAMLLAENPKVYLSLRAAGLPMKEWKKAFPDAALLTGTMDWLTATVSGTFSSPRSVVTIRTARLSVAGVAVKNIRGHVDVRPDGYGVDFLGTVAGTPLHVAGKGRGNDAPRLEIRSDRIDLAALAADIPELSGLGISGFARGDATVEGRKIRASLDGKNLRIAGLPVDAASVSLNGTTTQLSLDPIALASEGSTLTGKGTVKIRDGSPLLALAGSGKLQQKTAARLISDVPVSGPVTFAWSVEGRAADPVVTLDAEGRNLTLAKTVPVSSLTLRARYENGSVVFRDAGAVVLGGTVSLQGDVRQIGSKPRMALAATMRGVNLALLQRALGSTVAMAGQADGSATIEGPAESPVIRGALNAAGSVEQRPAQLRASLEMKDGAIVFPSINLSVLSTDLAGRGRITLPAAKKPGSVSLNATATKIDLRTLNAAAGLDLPLFGTVVAELSVSGKTDAPAFSLSLTAPELRAYGLNLTGFNAQIRPSPARRTDPGIALLLKASLGGRPLQLFGKLIPGQDSARLILRSERTPVDLAGLSEALAVDRTGLMSGKVSFSMDATLRGDSISGTGNVGSKRATFSGFEIRDFSFPFAVSDEGVTVTKGTASLYGGDAKVTGAYRFDQGSWTCNIAAVSMDLDQITRPLLAAPAKITGSADLTMKTSGTSGRFLFVFGDGTFSARNGVISGFPALKKLSEAGTLRFNSLLSNFNVDGKQLYLLPGSRASAHPGDNVYRYFGVNGTVGLGTTDPFDLKCSGEINLRALNTVLGALQGLLSIDGTLASATFLQNFLTGLVGGLSTKDFRETSFSLKGTWDKPLMSDFKVAQPAKRGPDIPWTTSTKGTNGNGREFTIRIDIPTGPGADSTPDAEDQVKKQILENIMKSIVTTGESE